MVGAVGRCDRLRRRQLPALLLTGTFAAVDPRRACSPRTAAR
jgi:hypothetical protein